MILVINHRFGCFYIKDWLTDLTLVESAILPADEYGGASDVRVHEGMLYSAQYIRDRLLGTCIRH